MSLLIALAAAVAAIAGAYVWAIAHALLNHASQVVDL